jgi:hypothetical protein
LITAIKKGAALRIKHKDKFYFMLNGRVCLVSKELNFANVIATKDNRLDHTQRASKNQTTEFQNPLKKVFYIQAF